MDYMQKKLLRQLFLKGISFILKNINLNTCLKKHAFK